MTEQSEIGEHNIGQQQYFESRVKTTMVPTETPYNLRHVQEVLQFAQYQPGERTLEVGCGMGRHTLLLAKLGVQVEGLDLSAVLLERLREYSAGKFDIPLHSADILNPPDELKGEFNLVLGFFTLHHLIDIKKSFLGLAQFLKPGGRIVVLEPNPLNPLYHIQIIFTPGMSYKGERSLMAMRPKIIFQAMQDAGLREYKLRRFGFFPPFLTNRPWGNRLEAILEKVPFFRPILPFQLFRGDL